jgi:SWI/SNF-related matrix-associated actin-dependent regulator of chromatin subfamily A member 5
VLFNSFSAASVSGTPLQNNLHELWAILQLLYSDIFKSSASFDDAFNLTKSVVNTQMLALAHHLLQPFMLRRIKNEVEATMPPKIETKVGAHCFYSTLVGLWVSRLWVSG